MNDCPASPVHAVARPRRRARSRLAPCILLIGLVLFGATTRPAPAGKLPVLRVGGEEYVMLRDVAAFYGMTLHPGQDQVRMAGPRSTLEFRTHGRRARLNGIGIWLLSPLRNIEGRWALTRADMDTFIDPVLRTAAHLFQEKERLVLLDPGHGGKDSGACSRRGLQEKRLTLDVARRVREKLTAQGIRVQLTRTDDRFITLAERSRMAARRGADLFVSIHMNSAGSRHAQGLETYVLTAPGYASSQAAPGARVPRVEYPGNRHDGVSTCLAYGIQKATVKETGSLDRGLRHARFAVLKHAPCPAALVECGFLSNLRDESMLRSSRHLDSLARGIARGVEEYMDAIRRARVVMQHRTNPFGPGSLVSRKKFE